MESLVERLYGHLQQEGVDVRLNTPVKEVVGSSGSKAKKPEVILDNDQVISSDHGWYSSVYHQALE
jgi:phytoene dehydrogenase-like protein